MQAPKATQPRIVIIGAGFGGLYAAKRLAGAAAEITLIDRSNHHLFQPLLYQVATAALSAADIATPIRAVFARHRNVRVIMGELTGVDPAARTVAVRDIGDFPYDILVGNRLRHLVVWPSGVKSVEAGPKTSLTREIA
jgi:NADH dehydrogenase